MQFEILQTFLDVVVFPQPFLSRADVVQHARDFVLVTYLPREVFEDSVLYVSRSIAHLACIPRMLRLVFKSLVCFVFLDFNSLCL